MEGEMKNFMMVCISVLASLSYSYIIGRSIPKGSFRLLFLLPVLSIFLLLPLSLSSIHLIGITAFSISWLAIFKLLLFAFGQGPLSLTTSTMSLLRFISLSSLPIKIKHNPTNKSKPKSKSPLNYAIQIALLVLTIHAYNYKHYYIFIHLKFVYILFCLHIYLSLELILAMLASLAKALLGHELESQFNELYLSTSLIDYWGRRWNTTVTFILRPIVYEPTQQVAMGTMLGRRWPVLASLMAVMATFLVSGLMHELIFYYLGRTRPTWENTWYHLLHGFCLACEIAVKKALAGRWKLHRVVSITLTIGFVMVTAYWLFFPPLLRCDALARTLDDYSALIGFVKQVLSFKS
ncbi:acyl-CoA--sterol O-acyltransferase 1-like [Telopea speciosissima]|uniref:acyl-CoA--sterol O-acyltransferase 1-like n=1 Tax=Telopea speciosissima TaxID=54955 RepID=UPI001CC439C8|nr:acyl-CoA--sterol O-acyltransferase 1-like [Telopea speciosissima]